jgi:acido-empty-quinoprotein group A
MIRRPLLPVLMVALLATGLSAQELNPNSIVHPQRGSWPTYNGDYSGRRFSPLKQVNQQTVRGLSLCWVFQTGLANGGGAINSIKSTPLVVDGMLYLTVPDHVWAVDAASGKQIWSYEWKSKGGIHIGNRGVGVYRRWLFFETPDNHLVSLDKNTGRFHWSVEIADLDLEYFSGAAPLVIGDHVIIGVGGDSLDVPGYVEARDPESGALQWHFRVDPQPGEPGFDSWPSEQAAAHGGGMSWLTGTYDPNLKLYFFGTGNPNPVFAGQSRSGDNLYTASIIALDPDTGRMAWYFQVSPHDTHDWDAVETPVMIDVSAAGRKEKLLAQASRNGYFFVLDRTGGKNVLTAPFVNVNWVKSINRTGQPVGNPRKFPQTDGALTSPCSRAANWPAPSFDPDTGLFYVNATEGFCEWYLTDISKNPEGYGGNSQELWGQLELKAIDYKTGMVRWRHPYIADSTDIAPGILTTKGGLLFTGDATEHFIAYDPETGGLLWHAGLGARVSNGPITYAIGGWQFVAVAAGSALYSFALAR